MISNSRLASVVAAFRRASDGVYLAPAPSGESSQAEERGLREQVAAQSYDDYFAVIARSHSIPVMDREVDRFLAALPKGALILDVGGCWGWHWRRLPQTRPDVGVLIVDFVRGNLVHANRVLGGLVGTQVALMHADATALPFQDADGFSSGFDAVWTVQVFQHIPDFARACSEAHRVLKRGGHFANYSLHITPLTRLIRRLFGKTYHIAGLLNDSFHLNRASDSQRRIVEGIFGAVVSDRYTECLFHPDLKLGGLGQSDSLVGRFDALLSNAPWLGRLVARQRAFEVIKP